MPRALTILLDETEMELAEHVGLARDQYARSKGYGTRYGIVGNGLTTADNHILGVEAELAVARALSLPWEPNVGRLDGVDVGRDVEVRARRLRSETERDRGSLMQQGSLYLGKRDRGKGRSAFVLAHRYLDTMPGQITLLGWAFGREVLQRRYWMHDPDMGNDGVCRMPHADLKPIEALIAHLKDKHDAERRTYLECQLARYRDGRGYEDQRLQHQRGASRR